MMSRLTLALVLATPFMLMLAIGVTHVFSGTTDAGDMKPAVVFFGGHETDPKDRGRPVVLIAAALGVKPEVFREAFSGVTPAKDGKPSTEEAQRNKKALMKVLRPYGVTNERLDEVSDHYRYKPGKDNLWKTSPAKAYAVLENGKVKRIVVTDSGSGYSTVPKATIQGMGKVGLKVTIEFSKELKKNGAISLIDVE